MEEILFALAVGGLFWALLTSIEIIIKEIKK